MKWVVFNKHLFHVFQPDVVFPRGHSDVYLIWNICDTYSFVMNWTEIAIFNQDVTLTSFVEIETEVKEKLCNAIYSKYPLAF